MPTGSAMAGAKDGSSLRDRVPTYDLLGVRVDGLTVQALYAAIAEAIDAPGTTVVGNHNVHSIYLYHRDPKMRSFYARTRYVFIDGMPLVMAGRLLDTRCGESIR